MKMRSIHRNLANYASISLIEPKSLDEAKLDEDWIIAMKKKLNQFKRNNIWSSVPKSKDHPIIGTEWSFWNKVDKLGIIIRNKAQLVVQGYNWEKSIYFHKTFARLEDLKPWDY